MLIEKRAADGSYQCWDFDQYSKHRSATARSFSAHIVGHPLVGTVWQRGDDRVIIESITGKVTEDRQLELWAHCTTNSGFCLMAGKFWEKIIKLDQATFDRYVAKRIIERAEAELDAEAAVARQNMIAARAEQLREQLLPVVVKFGP